MNVSSAGAAGKAGDADFTADTAPGVTVTAPNNIANWDTPAFGDSAADDVIEKVMQSIRYGPTMQVALGNIVPGNTYKLQLLFYEQCCGNRGFSVYVDGHLLAQDFSPPEIQGAVNDTAHGAVISAEVETQRHGMLIAVRKWPDPRGSHRPERHSGWLTLEVIKGEIPAGAPALKIEKAPGNIVITFEGTLQVATRSTELHRCSWNKSGHCADQRLREVLPSGSEYIDLKHRR